MLVSLSMIFLALAAHLEASSEDAAPSTSMASPASEMTEIGGRLLYRHSLLPVEVDPYNGDSSDAFKQATLEEALAPFLIAPLVGIVAEYGRGRSRQFAEELYGELAKGKMGLLHQELYDLESGTLKEPHHFWDYLAGEEQPAPVFVYMLKVAWEADPEVKPELDRFAVLVSQRVPQTGYFVAQYLEDSDWSPLCSMSLDAWPQALTSSQSYLESLPLNEGYDAVPVVHYLLIQRNVQRLKAFLAEFELTRNDCLYLFPTLYAIHPALPRDFFELAFAKDSASDQEAFEAAAPIAMGLDPSLSNALIAIARENGWAEPVADKFSIKAELADVAEIGGNVHLQPLQPVAKLVVDPEKILDFVASLTLKTVAALRDLRLHVAAENVLCAFSAMNRHYFHIRSFETDSVSTHECDPGHPVRVSVQHGDVVAVNRASQFPLILKEQANFTGLSGKVRFERVKSFFYSANDGLADFLAIVEHDRPREKEGAFCGALKASEIKVAEMDGGKGEKHGSEKTRLGKQQPSRKQKLERQQNGGQDALQES